MDWSNRIQRLPRAFDADRGVECANAIGTAKGELRELLAGAAGSSPYLAGLVTNEASWLADALTTTPEEAWDEIIKASGALADESLSSGLRIQKRRAALLIALGDLAGFWSLEEVTSRLSAFANLAIHRAVTSAVERERNRGKLPSVTSEAALRDAGGLSVLAMGKLGANELNYSSDVDLICLFDESRFEPDDYHIVRAGFVRATREMSRIMSDPTEDGYVFRTDLRLRPDPAVTPVCLSMEAAERYYESVGRTWERAAYIKAAAVAGDRAAGSEFLKRLEPFVWRKHLDFAAIEDAHDMRLRIREHKGLGGPITLPGHNMKLGRGGIREIEFFTQTRQIIAGGRDPSLRVKGTVDGLAALAKGGWIDQEIADELTPIYRAHREIEHRLQMVADAQTHTLPNNEQDFDRLAALCGADSANQLRAEIFAGLTRVHTLIESFFEGPGAPSEAINAEQAEIVARWMRFPALRTDRARARFDRLRPLLFERLNASAHPSAAISSFEGFLAGLPSGVQLFALFEANPDLLELIVDIAGTAPALAQYLGQNSQVLDAVIAGTFFEDWPGRDGLVSQGREGLRSGSDYEAKLDALRRWMKEWKFGIGVHFLRGLVDADTAGQRYADLAEAVIELLLPEVIAEFAQKHGQPPGRGVAVLGMGSLGARALSSTSDLDLIVIYDAGGGEESTGPRPLPARTYFARLTQALVTALSAPMSEGRLYEVDMRLRPSGRKGPVATSWKAFQAYQKEEAWVWEHLALTRARVVVGNRQLSKDIEEFRDALLESKRDRAKIIAGVTEMRGRLFSAKPQKGDWDVRSGPGGAQDIEMFGQAAALVQGSTERTTARQISLVTQAFDLNSADAEQLASTQARMRAVIGAQKLLIGGPLDPADLAAPGQSFLLEVAGAESLDELRNDLIDARARSAELIQSALLFDQEA